MLQKVTAYLKRSYLCSSYFYFILEWFILNEYQVFPVSKILF